MNAPIQCLHILWTVDSAGNLIAFLIEFYTKTIYRIDRVFIYE